MISMVVTNDNIAVYLFDTVLTSYMQSRKSLAYAKTIVQFDVLYTLLMESTATSDHVLFLSQLMACSTPMDRLYMRHKKPCGQHTVMQESYNDA